MAPANPGYTEAAKRIAGGDLPGLLLLHGDDPFLQGELVRVIRDSLRSYGEVDVVDLRSDDKDGDEGEKGSGKATAFDLQSIRRCRPGSPGAWSSPRPPRIPPWRPICAFLTVWRTPWSCSFSTQRKGRHRRNWLAM
jgi:hypothetical protein